MTTQTVTMPRAWTIPVRKLPGISVELIPPTVDDLVDNCRHGLDQRVNDATSGIKRTDYESGAVGDKKFAEACMAKVNPVVTRINAGLMRSRAPITISVEAALRATTPEQLAALLTPEQLAAIAALTTPPAPPTPEKKKAA